MLGADLHLLHIVQSPAYAYRHPGVGRAGILSLVDMEKICEGTRSSLCDLADGNEEFPGRIESHVIEGAGVADTIRESADKFGVHLIVMGTHGRTGLAHVLLGSVAERTLRSSTCPVLTIRSSDEEEAD